MTGVQTFNTISARHIVFQPLTLFRHIANLPIQMLPTSLIMTWR